jgi:pyruvate/2-oxoglutarate dehydrogenase complex dihydrolipoamide acyltransferase (E2) component
MALKFSMPKLGHLMEEARVVRWCKDVGDHVDKDEVLLEVETDKAVVEVESPFAGVLLEIFVEADQTVPVGALLARYE